MTTVGGRIRIREDQLISYFLLIAFLDESFTELELDAYAGDNSHIDVYNLYFESNVGPWLRRNFKLEKFRKVFIQQRDRWLRDGRVYY